MFLFDMIVISHSLVQKDWLLEGNWKKDAQKVEKVLGATTIFFVKCCQSVLPHSLTLLLFLLFFTSSITPSLHSLLTAS
jgi:hypothetical protein